MVGKFGGQDLIHGQQHQIFTHDDVVKVRRQINVHECPDDSACEWGQKMPVVYEYYAAFPCEEHDDDHDDGENDDAWLLPLKECFSIAMSWSSPLRDGTPDARHTVSATRLTARVTRHTHQLCRRWTTSSGTTAAKFTLDI
jgi:hypothetical protein